MTDTKQTWKITHDDFGGYEIFDEKGDIIIQANENGSSLPWPVTAKLIVDSVNKVQQDDLVWNGVLLKRLTESKRQVQQYREALEAIAVYDVPEGESQVIMYELAIEALEDK